jgi:hypothetical protein
MACFTGPPSLTGLVEGQGMSTIEPQLHYYLRWVRAILKPCAPALTTESATAAVGAIKTLRGDEGIGRSLGEGASDHARARVDHANCPFQRQPRDDRTATSPMIDVTPEWEALAPPAV